MSYVVALRGIYRLRIDRRNPYRTEGHVVLHVRNPGLHICHHMPALSVDPLSGFGRRTACPGTSALHTPSAAPVALFAASDISSPPIDYPESVFPPSGKR